MTDVTTLLAGIKTREEAATEGPWEIDSLESGEHGVFAEEHHRLGCGTSQVAGFMTKANAEFLIAARMDVPRLVAAIEAVAGLHYEDLFRGHLSNGCKTCGHDWPCPTITAVVAALGGRE